VDSGLRSLSLGPHPYVVHRDASFRVRGPDGVEQTLRACGSMLEKDGAWKAFSYVTN
jgi:hypothetical protein